MNRLKPRRNVLITLICSLLLIGGGVSFKTFVWSDNDNAATVACADRTPTKSGEECTDTISFKGATGTRHYIAEERVYDDGVKAIHFDWRTITIQVDELTLDNLCAAEAISSIRPDKPSVAATYRANQEACAEIRVLTYSPAYDAVFWCERLVRANLQPNPVADNWNRVVANFFTDEAVEEVCSTPLWPTPRNEVTHV